MISRVLNATLYLAVAAGSASAQATDRLLQADAHATHELHGAPISVESRASAPLWQTIGLGVVGGAAGLLIGEQLAYEREEEEAADAMEFVAPGIGVSLMIPIGVHVGNNRAGSLLPGLLAASGVAIAAIVVSGAQEDTEFKAFNFVPPAQLLVATVIERWTARHKAIDRE